MVILHLETCFIILFVVDVFYLHSAINFCWTTDEVVKILKRVLFFWFCIMWFIYTLSWNLTAENSAVHNMTSGREGGVYYIQKKRTLYINMILHLCCKLFYFFLLLAEISHYWIPVTSYGVKKEPDINTPSAFSYSYELVTAFVIPESYD